MARHRLAVLRADGADGQGDTRMWMRYAAYAAPVLLVAALTAGIVLTSDAGPQPTTAATVARQAGGDLAEAPPPEPQATATPTPPCENGTVVPSPAANPGLVADCTLLLEAKDTLRGTETLNWSADRAITSWEGISVGGSPRRVTRLFLDRNSSPGRPTLTGTIPAALGGLSKLQGLTLTRHELTGTIPAELGSLSELTDLQLYSNELTGGIPPELSNLSNLTRLALRTNPLGGEIPVELGKLSSLTSLSLENTQLTGSIPASLGDLQDLQTLKLYGNRMLTGCIPESLRGITLNDLRHLDLEYCTTTTTYALTTSVEGNGRISPLPGSYSYLSGASVTVTATPDASNRIASWGGDCSGSGTATTCTLTLDANRTASITFERITHSLTVTVSGEGGSVEPGGTTTQYEGDEVTLTASWNDATHSFTGWGDACSGATASTCLLTMDANKTVTATFAALPATRCASTTAADCIRAVYKGAPADYAQVADIPADLLLTAGTDGRYQVERGQQYTVVTAARLPEGWTRFYLQWSPLEYGQPSPVSASQLIAPVGTTYTFTVTEDEAASTLLTFDLHAARPFIRPRPDGKPEIGATVVTTVFSVETTSPRYSSYDATGAVTTAGSYAFLMPDDDSDDEDATTAVTTYEALRDGTTTALLIHKSDAHGASQAALYDAVEAGDLFEWHEADDCFVRYKVTEVKPDPAGTVPRKLLAVEWMTYAFTGCSGAVSVTAAATVDWGELLDLGGTSLTAPVVHGVYQIVPADWKGATIAPEEPRPATWSYVPAGTSDLAEARELPYWRDPALPEGWVFEFAYVDRLGGPAYGYCATYLTEPRLSVLDGGRITRSQGFKVCGYFAATRFYPKDASWHGAGSARETRVIAGRPAQVIYSPQGSSHDFLFPVTLWVYDAATQAEYRILGADLSLIGANVDAVIAIARGLFEDE